jgi:hypothetical protein
METLYFGRWRAAQRPATNPLNLLILKGNPRRRAAGTTDALALSREATNNDPQESIMRALHTAMALETGPVRAPVVIESPAGTRSTLRNMVLFLLAPFIGLLYAILLPFVGLGMLAWIATRS